MTLSRLSIKFQTHIMERTTKEYTAKNLISKSTMTELDNIRIPCQEYSEKVTVKTFEILKID